MNPSTIQSLRAAISESIASRNVPTLSVPDIEAAVRFIERNFYDVDWDPHPDRITIFGDDPSVPCDENGDGMEGHFVLEILRCPRESVPRYINEVTEYGVSRPLSRAIRVF